MFTIITRCVNGVSYFSWLLLQILLAGYSLCLIIAKNQRCEEVMDWVECSASLWVKVIYASSITLTPGTTTLAFAQNRIYVYAIDKSVMQDLQKGEMLARISRIFET